MGAENSTGLAVCRIVSYVLLRSLSRFSNDEWTRTVKPKCGDDLNASC